MAVYREDNSGVVALLLVVVVLLVGGFLFYQLGDDDDADQVDIQLRDDRGYAVDHQPATPEPADDGGGEQGDR